MNTKDVTDSMIERGLLDKLRNLDRDAVIQRTRQYLNNAEIDGVMVRRDKIAEIYDDLIARKGEKAVVYENPVAKQQAADL